MRTGRRLATLLLVLLLIGAPAVALSLACVGQSCSQPQPVAAAVPFCPLPPDLRTAIANGYYKGRSPEVFAVAKTDDVYGNEGSPHGTGGTWPYPGQESDATRVPLVLAGDRIHPSPDAPRGPLLSQVAPTLADAMGLSRPHPEVRSGKAIEGVVGRGAPPRLVLMVGIKGLGSAYLDAEPKLLRELRELGRHGYLTLDADVDSLPIDSGAALTTAGVGALPSEHGITGSAVRNDEGTVVTAWGPGSPDSTLATLGDDLLQTDPMAFAGMVGSAAQDRGLIGDGWYLGGRAPTFVKTTPTNGAAAFEDLLSQGYGRDAHPDLIAATLPPGSVTRLGQLVDAASAAADGRLTIAVFGTGSAAVGRMDPTTAKQVVDDVERATTPGIADVAVAGGLFIDEQVAAGTETSSGEVVQALKRIRGPDGKLLFADAFPAFSIQFARYC